MCYLSQFASDANYASLVVGFPELEFSSNEVYAWPKSEEAVKYVPMISCGRLRDSPISFSAGPTRRLDPH